MQRGGERHFFNTNLVPLLEQIFSVIQNGLPQILLIIHRDLSISLRLNLLADFYFATLAGEVGLIFVLLQNGNGQAEDGVVRLVGVLAGGKGGILTPQGLFYLV